MGAGEREFLPMFTDREGAETFIERMEPIAGLHPGKSMITKSWQGFFDRSLIWMSR